MVESEIARRTFARAERLTVLACALPSPEGRAMQEQIARDLVADIGPLRPRTVAEILTLDEKTVRVWAGEGVLRVAVAVPHLLIDPASVLDVCEILAALRTAGKQHGLLDEVYRRLADRSVLAGSDVQEGLRQMRNGEGVTVRPAAR
jgi:hypothetical protein